MDPIFRRSSFYYAMSLGMYMALMGRYLVTRAWPVFEIIPLFVPIWIVGAMLASESDESYAFLRTLPVPDRAVVRTKFAVILLAVAVQWCLMLAAAILRLDDGIADISTLVYVTFVCGFGLLAAAGYQIAIWRYGLFVMKPVMVATLAAGMVVIILHMVALKRFDGWFAFSRLGPVEWLGGAPWLSVPVIAAITLLMFARLMRLGVRIKASSEAHL